MAHISVLTLNIWNKEGPWEVRRELIRQWVRLLDPDVLAFQEVLKGEAYNQVEDLFGDMQYHLAYAMPMAWWHDPGLGIGNLIASRWPIASTTELLLPLGGRDDQRVLLGALIESPFGILPFYTTHLTSKLGDGHIREHQVQAIAEGLRHETSTSGLPIVLCGDFNAEPESTEMRYLRGQHALSDKSFYMMDAWRVANETGRGDTFTRQTSYRSYRQFDQRLDYIYVERVPEDRVRVSHCSVVCDKPSHGIYPSDHFGIYMELEVPREFGG